MTAATPCGRTSPRPWIRSGWNCGAPDMKAEGEYDYVIVGAGTAGCVLANRLTANGKATCPAA